MNAPNPKLAGKSIHDELQTETKLPAVVQLLRIKYIRRLRGITRDMERIAATGRPPRKGPTEAQKVLDKLTPKSLGEEAARICQANKARKTGIHLEKKAEELKARKPRNAVENAFGRALNPPQ